MKKKLTVLLCLMCLLALVLAGCGGGGTTTEDTEGLPTTPDGRKIITIGMPETTMVLDYDTNAYTMWLEEVSGYEIEFVYYATGSGDYSKQLATETASGTKLPDILWRFRLNDDLIERYGEDGFFVDLSEYFNDREKSANYWNMVEKFLSEEEQDKAWMLIHSDYRENIGGDVGEGAVYAFPTMETSMIDTMDFAPMINQNWLDVLQLQAPTNLQELKEVLIAFRDRDPNGNGVSDEIPMLGAKDGISAGLLEWIINFYIYYDPSTNFNLDADGNLYMPQKENAYREALKYLRDLVEKGLLHVKTLTNGFAGLRSVLQTADVVGVTVGHSSQIFTEDSNAILKWRPLNLYGYAFDNANVFYRDVFITDSCKDVDAAWDLLMVLCTEESAYRMRYGERGVDWDWADEGAESAMGIPAAIKVYNDIWGKTCNQSWMLLGGGIYPYSENEQNQITGEESDFLKYKYQIQRELRTNYDEAKAKVDTALVCPLLRFNAEENEIAKNRSDFKKTVTTWCVYFVNGTKDIYSDADWNEYLKALDEAGAEAYRDAAQMCYERMYK